MQPEQLSLCMPAFASRCESVERELRASFGARRRQRMRHFIQPQCDASVRDRSVESKKSFVWNHDPHRFMTALATNFVYFGGEISIPEMRFRRQHGRTHIVDDGGELPLSLARRHWNPQKPTSLAG